MNHVPVCVKCRKEMRPERNGVKYVEYADFGPYKIWDSDKWICPECGLEILAGFGYKPLVEHYQPEFLTDLANVNKEKDTIHERRP